MKIRPLHLIDGYKVGHRDQYPDGTNYVYSNLTFRKSRVKDVNYVVAFGFQYLKKEYLIDLWNKEFFFQPKAKVVSEYKRILANYLGNPNIRVDHVEALHDLGYLPIKIKAIKEGTLVPIGVPLFTIVNTHPDFFWLTNYLETLLSNILWKPITSATTAFEYRKRFEQYVSLTGYAKEFVIWQGHDFSFRGMSGIEDAVMSGAGHLLSFSGTDTIPAIDFIEDYYGANSDEELIGGSVNATEHSVMCLGMKDGEIGTIKRLIDIVYPSGIVSIVSDTWDLWKVLTEYLPTLKNDILARDGRVVVRPDSGDPTEIICGVNIKHFDNMSGAEFFFSNNMNGCRLFSINGVNGVYEVQSHTGTDFVVKEVELSPAEKGAYQLLWETFSGTINDKGYKELNGKVGLIYGDSITLDRQKMILEKLEAKGFSASNLVLGIGSFTYEYVTRDTFGGAMKATWGVVNGEEREIFKDPITDSGFKKSAKGLLKVYKDEFGTLKFKDQCTKEEENEGELQVIFEDSVLYNDTTFKEVRETLLGNLK